MLPAQLTTEATGGNVKSIAKPGAKKKRLKRE
jgi:hypothetical protein